MGAVATGARRASLPWRLLAALPAAAAAVAFAAAWLAWPGGGAPVLAKSIQLEFLAIHAVLFLGVFILLPVGALFRWLRWIPVALMAWLYARGAYGLLGWAGVASLAFMLFGTYGALLFAPRTTRGRRIAEIATRWVVALLGYGLLANALGLPELVNEWTDMRESVALGALYFTLLAAVEATPLYARIRGD